MRAVAVAAIVLVAVLVTPAALGNPALNSADLILIVSPAAVLAVGWPRRSRPPAVSEHFEARRGSGRRPQAAPPPPR